jgi:hypothetical protein
MKPYMKVTKDFTEEFQAAIRRFKNDNVLVGIPAENTEREEGREINNATILAINHFGSEANNIPPRPVLAIGIKNAQPKIAEQFKLMAQNVLKKGISALDRYYERAGIIAANSVKKAINDQEGFEGPSAATLKAREAAGFKGTKSLVVTGQTRNAITSVVKRKGI